MENKSQSSYSFIKTIMPAIVLMVLNVFISYVVVFFGICIKIRNYTKADGDWFEYIMKVSQQVATEDYINVVFIVYAVSGLVIFGLWYYLVFVKKNGEKIQIKESLKKLTTKPVAFIAGVVMFAPALNVLCSILVSILGTVFPSWMESYVALTQSAGIDGNISIPMVIYLMVLAPVLEELVFRGLVLKYARQGVGFWTAIILQAILFAGVHGNPLQSLFTFVMGLLIGYLVLKSDTMLMGIIVHIAFNVSSLFVGNIIDSATKTPAIFGTLLFTSMVLAYLGFNLISKNILVPVKERKH